VLPEADSVGVIEANRGNPNRVRSLRMDNVHVPKIIFIDADLSLNTVPKLAA
jgi:hypothetical protein